VAVIVTGVELDTADVLMVNVAELAPARTVTLDWSAALVLFDERLMPIPPVAAGPDNVTVPVDLVPPTTEAGETVTLNTLGGLMVKVADFETLPSVPVMTADLPL
jgi:ABC-type Fe3+-hydroxamate transport system substrate-binding protein